VSRSDLAGKVCVVTGATQGIGKPTAAALAGLGATVILHGRDPEAVEHVRAEISKSTGNANVSGVVGRFDSLDDVRRVAQEILSRHARMDVLVNNAGTGATRRTLTDDGYEWQFGVNHLAPFLLTNLLLERMLSSVPARIVTVASGAHRRGALDLSDPNWTQRKYNPFQAYGDSKLANILFTRALAERLNGSGVSANCLHPGVVATNIFRSLGIIGRLFDLLARPWLLSPADGARTSIHLASAAAVSKVSGEYFYKCKVAATAPAARDMAAARDLWKISADMVGLAP
jgi:NAD(P)-dependent dehydrogenase (short-subunit alcohol dehydrogenase family)